MTKKFLFIIFIGFILSGTNCSNDCPDVYEFEIPVTVSPVYSSYQVGDTINVVSEFSDERLSLGSNNVYKLENYHFYPGTEIKKIEDTVQIDGLQFFDVIIPEEFDYQRFQYSQIQTLEGEYRYEENTYTLKFQLIPLKPGLYIFEHNSLAFFLEQDQFFPGKCPGATVNIVSNTNDGADNNIHLLEDSPSEFASWVLEKPYDRFHEFGGYCFYVVE